MFVEDLGQLEGWLFSRLIDELFGNLQRSSADDVGLLFDWLNRDALRPLGGLYADTRYVNGGLFDQPVYVHFDKDELTVLGFACEYDWRNVEPHIFGSLLEGALGKEVQWSLGAHYTYAADIQKVVGLCNVEPWSERIENAITLQHLRHFQQELLNFVVLDPACGSGNFLYVVYRSPPRVPR